MLILRYLSSRDLPVPETKVVFFADAGGACPLLSWLDEQPVQVQSKCIVRMERLAQLGYELRRPEADYLRDGIHELRATYQGIHYRILYFFSGKTAVISHGLVKEKAVPEKQIERAIRHKALFQVDSRRHTYLEE